MITVILNCYKRPQYLKEQIEAIRNQTVKVDDIFIWYNKPEDMNQYDISKLGCKTATCNHNFKFHGRFAFGLLAKTDYVAFFDDDTIPGNRWFENCLNTIEKGYDGILGSSGILLHGNQYNPHTKVGWNGKKTDIVTKVDLVGHAWFMKRQYLTYLWYEEPISWENGEDMQLSYMAQKHGNIKTYVPPHPPEDKSVWGSVNGHYGRDEVASFKTSPHMGERDRLVKKLISEGWRIKFMSKIKYLVVTRLGVKLPHSRNNMKWDEWYENSIHLMDTYCRASLKNQTDSNFELISIVDESVSYYGNLLENETILKISDVNDIPTILKSYIENNFKEYDYVIITRIDRDDCIDSNFVYNVKNIFMQHDITYVDISKCFLLDTKTNNTYVHTLYCMNTSPFISSKEPLDNIQTIPYSYRHFDIGKKFDGASTELITALQVIHDNNISNRVMGSKCKLDLNEYGIK